MCMVAYIRSYTIRIDVNGWIDICGSDLLAYLLIGVSLHTVKRRLICRYHPSLLRRFRESDAII